MTVIMLLSVLLSQIPGNSADSSGELTDTSPRFPGEEEAQAEEQTPSSRETEEEEPDSGPPPVIVIEKRSPSGALLRSAVLPGWGQFYNDEPVKGVILGVVEVGLLSWLITEYIQAEDARNDFLVTGDPADEARYEEHAQRRLDLIWYTSAAWLYGMLDAYVDAYLYSFESENRSFERDAGIGVVVYIPI